MKKNIEYQTWINKKRTLFPLVRECYGKIKTYINVK